jgi:hypothetical protein
MSDTLSSEESRDWMDAVADWVVARWRWMVVGVVVLFALNNFAGAIVGFTGLIAFANRIAGRVLKAKRVVQQVQGMVDKSDEL